MTRKHIISFLAAIAANIIIGVALGQEAGQALPENVIDYSKPFAKAETSALRLNEVHIKAVRSFTREYKNAADAKWYTTVDGFVVYFTHDNVKTRIFYNKKGNYTCTARYYNETVLPSVVRHDVRSRYYDYAIFHVAEISAAGTTAYLIKLEGKTSWMDIRVVDNEIEILKEYEK